MKKHIAIAAILAAASVSAWANCYGSGSFYTCNDSSGNSYNVNRYGNTTQVYGSNANTGSTWNQTSQTIGNTTYERGTAANGNSWNGTTSTYGGVTTHSGTDSNGNSYYKTCTAYGCY